MQITNALIWQSKVKPHGSCSVTVEAFDRRYDVAFSVLDGLLWDVILRREFMELHKSVNIHFGGLERPLHLGTLKPLKASVPVKLFEHISPGVRPIAVKSIRYSQADQEFIAREIRRLLQEDVIEKSTSPWRAQVVVARDESTGKKFVCWSGKGQGLQQLSWLLAFVYCRESFCPSPLAQSPSDCWQNSIWESMWLLPL